MAFSDACLSASYLYGACLLIFGMLGISFSPFTKRKEALQRLYGTPVPPKDNHSQFIRFVKAYFFRETLIHGLIIAFLIIRWHADPLLSFFLSAMISATLISQFKEMPTKFIPAMTILIGIAYMSMQLFGYLNGWHLTEITIHDILDDSKSYQHIDL